MSTKTIEPITKDKAIKYLNLYVDESDWDANINALYSRLSKKYEENQAKEMMRKILACTILLPAYEKGIIAASGSGSNLFFRCSTYHQFGERDWLSLFNKVLEQDKKISTWRKQARALGVIFPFQYAPLSRQAFNWLNESAAKNGVSFASNQDSQRSFENLILTYGGKNICNIYNKGNKQISSLPNWRSSYFVERLLFDLYPIEKVLLIKQQELEKTNPNLVQKFI